MVLFLQGWIRDACVTKDRLIITIKKRTDHNWNPHHPQLVPQPSYIITALLHINEFNPKCTSFYPVISFWEPVDGHLVQVYYKAYPWAPDHFISRQVCINISDYVETLSLWRRIICWDNLLYLTIVFLLIMPKEIIIVNGGVYWIKDHPSPVFPLEVCEDVKEFV